MIIYTDETVFNCNADCIVNTINCVGVMGKGLALEFSLRYPELNNIYVNQCKNKLIKTGQVYFYEIEENKIINFPTKYHFKYPSKIEWIESGLKDFVRKYKTYNIRSIAFPYLGCSNGELDKNDVKKVMEKYLNLEDITVYICSSLLLNGIEKIMIDRFRKTEILQLASKIKLNRVQMKNLIENQKKIYRFYEILNIDSIGITTYKNIYNYFYNKKNTEEIYYQPNLFDKLE